MAKSWTIGAKPDCDLVVNEAKVSGQHCRLSWDGHGFVLEDLGSTNGTYVNGVRVAGKVRITRSDSVTLGHVTPMPWPSEPIHSPPAPERPPQLAPDSVPTLCFPTAEMVIGRAEDCHHILDLPMISSRHARLFRASDRIWIEDLRSANGTFINGQRIDGSAPVKPGDFINLGSHKLILSVEAPVAAVIKSPLILDTPHSSEPIRDTSIRHGEENASAGGLPWRLAVLAAQAPAVAVVIALAFRTNTPDATGLASIFFWLGLATIWFGLSNAVFGNVLDGLWPRNGPALVGAPSLVHALLILETLSVCQCGLAWIVVARVAGLNGATLPVLGLMLLASAVGLALGLLVIATAPRPIAAWTMLGAVIVALGILGGGAWPPSQMPALVRLAADFTPSRRAFEGLLLLESDSVPVSDLAESSFPAETDRMGVKADATALALMTLGLAATAGFIAHERRREP